MKEENIKGLDKSEDNWVTIYVNNSEVYGYKFRRYL